MVAVASVVGEDDVPETGVQQLAHQAHERRPGLPRRNDNGERRRVERAVAYFCTLAAVCFAIASMSLLTSFAKAARSL